VTKLLKEPIIQSTRDMATTTETLHFENARAALQLLGGDERNLHALEEELSLKAMGGSDWRARRRRWRAE